MQPHIPVLVDEVIASLALHDDAMIVDGTFGAGGYSEAVLSTSKARIIALDRDPSVQPHVERLQQLYGARFAFHAGCFSQMPQLLAHILPVHGIMLDIGVSSMQLDTPDRGFSFRFDAPLDMRMEQQGRSAADIVNTTSEEELASLLWHYGEERASRKIARAIIAQRALEPISTTRHLRDLIHRIIPPRGAAIDPATRTFQALRIVVNDELGELTHGLEAAEQILAPQGRIAVVTFHSLEDRIVKHFLRDAEHREEHGTRHRPAPISEQQAPIFHSVTRKPIVATDDACRHNPRARSAKLRVAERTSAPARTIKQGRTNYA
ncbi:MAG: 16S rRNA (cytosine(1402)-N(4))-methyltransferase RsmH [Alphaproteobacteria bacterium]|nr:MAG: 16S rRNA (cytosine(1402)-N(4))-methyltransferase RsmH [Alphaproteobacteria bacterium]TAF15929.1 MAG: 16S rRNA (cytosine(1402)-N(4))-methyltransferase RsmH [Alphaproteobacteria bacterium]TAF39958.1 MAG: 16S rRNA (cytosine(1402)-N(4))-methyltransferase RsmH [Alphaproteobacteria bacterium]TAF76743.1 MAG: 16S rRNA (cytosine(1402)-N(4))-methyltransferase RsmH [Alphaproteobacteria bacterium]